MRKAPLTITLLLAVGGLTACTTYDDYAYRHGPGYSTYEAGRFGNYWYEGEDYHVDRWNAADAAIGGPGVDGLDPWLAHTPEGREIVAMGFGDGDAGWISEGAADAANIWFRRYADTDDDLRLTDEEIRLALVQGAIYRPGPAY